MKGEHKVRPYGVVKHVRLCAMSDDKNVPEIDVLEAQKRIEAGAVLVDVREPNEYKESHIPGSRLEPLSTFTEKYEDLPKDQPLIMQCRSGARSERAAKYLLEQGYTDVVNLTGGILAWQEAGLKIQKED